MVLRSANATRWRYNCQSSAILVRSALAKAPLRSTLALLFGQPPSTKKVKEWWVDQVLEKSLHQQVRVELKKQWEMEQIKHPWETLVEIPQQPYWILEGSIEPVFNQVQQLLLILGEPGSGKTNTLLQLAEELLAEWTSEQPVPLVLNLASWADGQLPLQKWVVKELQGIYGVSVKTADRWLREKRLSLLLDGLDEVAEKARNGCVEAINTFLQLDDYGVPGLVVCCRVREYGELSDRLRLQGAVRLQPLDQEQVDNYLQQAGESLAGLQQQLEIDEPLRELTQSPLMLNVMSLAYKNEAADLVVAEQSVEQRRGQLFERYIEKMFQRQKKSDAYNKAEMLSGLQWLAKQMQQRGQTIFLLDALQEDWLDEKQWVYRFIIGLNYGVIYGTTFGLVTESIYNGILLTMLIVIGISFNIFNNETSSGSEESYVSFSWQVFQKNWVEKAKQSFFAWLVIMLIFGLFAILFSFTPFFELSIFMAMGFSIGLLIVALFFGLFGAGLIIEKADSPKYINQEVENSSANIFLRILLGCLLLIMAWVVFDNYLLMAVFFLTIVWLIYSEISDFKNWSLRLALILTRKTPYNYASFLEYATHLIFLQRVGGSYIFIHRLLLEHFTNRKA